MTFVKFCGMMRPEDISAAAAAKADFVGFVFWPRSKRFVSPETASGLASAVPENIGTVGVFRDESLENLVSAASKGFLDAVQLHGSETERYIRMARNLTGLPIIKAFPPEKLDDAYSSEADYIMIDSGAGTGKTFGWEKLEGFGRPYFLAGGLDPDNVGSAIRKLRPFAVDVSSGIETGEFKDPDKMIKFKKSVDEADTATQGEE